MFSPVCWQKFHLCSLTHGCDPLLLLVMAVCAEEVCPGPGVFRLHTENRGVPQVTVLTLLLLQPHLQRETKYRGRK